MAQQNKTFGETLAEQSGGRPRQTREEFLADPETQRIMKEAQDAVMQGYQYKTDDSLRADPTDKPRAGPPAARGPAPPLNQPPIAPPSTPGQPIVRGKGARPGMPRAGGGRGGPVHPIMPQMRPSMPNPDAPTNPLGLSPNSPFKYESGGAVKKSSSPRGGAKGKDGREAVAGLLSDYLGDRLMRRYREEAAIDAQLRPVSAGPSPSVSGVPMYAKGGRVSDFGFAKGGGTNYGKDYRKGK